MKTKRKMGRITVCKMVEGADGVRKGAISFRLLLKSLQKEFSVRDLKEKRN